MAGLADGFVRMAVRLGMVCALALTAMPVSAASYAQTQPSTRTMNGIEVSGRFLEVWGKQGNERDSLYVNGLPITPRRSEISLEDGRAYDTQWFERARYELHTENKQPNDMLLGRLGASRVEGHGKVDPSTGRVADPSDTAFVGIDKPSDLSTSKLWFPETRHTLSGKLLDAWKQYGGLSQFGFTLSEPLEEVSQADGKPYTVQYFERNRMELHPEKPAPYDVELGLLGVEQFGARAVPGDELPIAPPKDVKSSKDEIKIVLAQEPTDLAPFNTVASTLRIRSLIEDGLVGRDDNENLFPLDAWYVPTLENGGAYFVGTGEDRHLVVKYKIRQGIKWSDGVELTSNDAIFAYRLALNPDVQAPNRQEYMHLQNVDNPDKYTVIYNYMSFKQAVALWNSLSLSTKFTNTYRYLHPFLGQRKPVISRLYSEIGAIYPEHALAGIAPKEIATSPYARVPIGTGPYKVTKWTEYQELILERNEHYTLTSKPVIKKIRLQPIYGEFLARLQTGEIDLITSESFVVPPANAADLLAIGIVVASRPAATWEHIDFYGDYPPFKEKAVREAIFRAINRQGIVDKVYRGMARTMNGVVPLGVYYSLENTDFARTYPDIAAKYKLPIYPYDPERARQLLEGAGWRAGPDGIRAKGGVKLSFEYATTINAIRQQIQYLVVADLKAVGIDAVQKAYPSSVFFGDPNPRTLGVTKLAMFSYVTTRDSDFSTWLCDENILRGSEPRGYCNQKVDDLNSIFNSELDVKTQVAAAAEAQMLLMQDIALIPLVQRSNIEVVTAQLANYKITNSTTSSFWNARQWYFR